MPACVFFHVPISFRYAVLGPCICKIHMGLVYSYLTISCLGPKPQNVNWKIKDSVCAFESGSPLNRERSRHVKASGASHKTIQPELAETRHQGTASETTTANPGMRLIINWCKGIDARPTRSTASETTTARLPRQTSHRCVET